MLPCDFDNRWPLNYQSSSHITAYKIKSCLLYLFFFLLSFLDQGAISDLIVIYYCYIFYWILLNFNVDWNVEEWFSARSDIQYTIHTYILINDNHILCIHFGLRQFYLALFEWQRECSYNLKHCSWFTVSNTQNVDTTESSSIFDQ